MCELDIIFNFEKAYFILDEFLMGGEIQETSKQTVNRCIEASDMLQEVRVTDGCSHHKTHLLRERVTAVAWLSNATVIRFSVELLFLFSNHGCGVFESSRFL